MVEAASDGQRAQPGRKPVLWLAVGTAVGMFVFLGWVCVRAFTA
jgi:hypothetical protein